MSTDLNAEHIRILEAAAAGIFSVNEHGRYVIFDPSAPSRHKRPARRERQQLQDWGLLGRTFVPDPGEPLRRSGFTRGTFVWRITDKGREALTAGQEEGR